jgi:carbamoyltransferase
MLGESQLLTHRLDAFNCFMGTELDNLVIGNCILDKNNQNQNLKKDYTENLN